MLHLWGRISSINVRKVVWAAQELGLSLQRTDAGGQFGIVKEADYRRKNPNALVPLVEDGEVLIWESNVIVRYLCAKYSPGNFYPAGLPQRFAAEQWMDWQQTTFNPAGRAAFVQLIRTPAEQRNAALIAQSVAATEPLLALLDAHLADHAYMGGEQFGMADIPLGCEMHRWFGLPQPRPARPHLDRWYQNLLARPASRGVLDLPLS
ncbi:glutathione S-transferase [Polaromonas sp. CF318]|uniref:glutathione S-transferase n=1 Tax=Polaromonas sp. CF318 TaxID=1144318 RepID=UPI0002711EA8|nr:glutathione S-transferase [Polaromonas sp. CF318]EJL90400.1 glutathione S-transferase [Polaromonas sp. CF318]